ncbi:hypothetical protein V8G54_023965 [Vigna mungo]|uniref:Uncharacterized protein n=1 Tax=Vigna mungo TaxID=3915 RepID=A0AAQ3RPP4_VIGMU
MISSKKMIQMAWKWQKEVTKYQRKRLVWPKIQENAATAEGCSVWTKAEKGHFVVYILYLKNNIFRELFKLAEEEFGLSSNVPLTLPCEATLMEYVITLIERNVTKDLEEAVLMFIATVRCHSSYDLLREPTNQRLLCSF